MLLGLEVKNGVVTRVTIKLHPHVDILGVLGGCGAEGNLNVEIKNGISGYDCETADILAGEEAYAGAIGYVKNDDLNECKNRPISNDLVKVTIS